MAPFKPGSPAWRAGFEHARRQAFAIATSAGDPAVRIAQMVPAAPVRDLAGDEMMARLAGKPPEPAVLPTVLHERVDEKYLRQRAAARAATVARYAAGVFT